MASTMTVTVIGNSGEIVLPGEILARLNLHQGDQVLLVEEAQGFRVLPYDADFAVQLEAAHEVMTENHEVLRKLAE